MLATVVALALVAEPCPEEVCRPPCAPDATAPKVRVATLPAEYDVDARGFVVRHEVPEAQRDTVRLSLAPGAHVVRVELVSSRDRARGKVVRCGVVEGATPSFELPRDAVDDVFDVWRLVVSDAAPAAKSLAPAKPDDAARAAVDAELRILQANLARDLALEWLGELATVEQLDARAAEIQHTQLAVPERKRIADLAKAKLDQLTTDLAKANWGSTVDLAFARARELLAALADTAKAYVAKDVAVGDFQVAFDELFKVLSDPAVRATARPGTPVAELGLEPTVAHCDALLATSNERPQIPWRPFGTFELPTTAPEATVELQSNATRRVVRGAATAWARVVPRDTTVHFEWSHDETSYTLASSPPFLERVSAPVTKTPWAASLTTAPRCAREPLPDLTGLFQAIASFGSRASTTRAVTVPIGPTLGIRACTRAPCEPQTTIGSATVERARGGEVSLLATLGAAFDPHHAGGAFQSWDWRALEPGATQQVFEMRGEADPRAAFALSLLLGYTFAGDGFRWGGAIGPSLVDGGDGHILDQWTVNLLLGLPKETIGVDAYLVAGAGFRFVDVPTHVHDGDRIVLERGATNPEPPDFATHTKAETVFHIGLAIDLGIVGDLFSALFEGDD